MRVDRIVSAALALGLLAPAAAAAAPLVTRQTTTPEGDVATLIAAERGFAKHAAETNIRDAFFDALSNESIIFRPGPVNGHEYYLGRPANPGPLLTWRPTYAEISGSSDLGWTTGPWEYASSKDKPAEAFGHFATVWQRGTDHRWRVLIDEGHSCAQPPPESLAWAVGRGRLGEGNELPKLSEFGKQLKDLLATDEAYSHALAAKGMGAALAEFADEDVLLYREEKPAIVGASAAGQQLAHEWDAGAEGWTTTVGAVSKAIDLAYTYGSVAVPAKDPAAKSSRKIFRIWRRDKEGPWRLALDVTNPLPPPPAPPKPPKPAKPPKGASAR